MMQQKTLQQVQAESAAAAAEYREARDQAAADRQARIDEGSAQAARNIKERAAVIVAEQAQAAAAFEAQRVVNDD
jgi:hypothetical protein